MNAEQRGDITLAIVVIVAMLVIGFMCGRAWACDSFDECMEHTSGAIPSAQGADSFYEQEYLKAIAYKLDEISKKLDKPKDKPMPEWCADHGGLWSEKGCFPDPNKPVEFHSI